MSIEIFAGKWYLVVDKSKPENKAAAQLIEAIREGRPGAFEELYDRYRAKFLRSAAKRFYATPNDLEDGWQEALFAFEKAVKNRKLTTLSCKPDTFLFEIGYRWLKKHYRKVKWFWYAGERRDVLAAIPELTVIEFEDDLWEEERAVLRWAMQQLPPKCRQILTERHYGEKTIEELLTLDPEHPYKNKASVYSTLNECMDKLKKIIQSKLPKP